MDNRPACSIAYEPSAGKFLVCVLDDGSVHLRNNSSRRVSVIQVEGAINVAVSSDGRTIAIGCLDGLVRLWDWKTRSIVRSLEGFPGPVKLLAFSWSGSSIVGCSGETLKKLHVSEDSVRPMAITSTPKEVSSIAVGSFKGSEFIMGGLEDGTVQLWSLKHGDLMQTIEIHHGPIISINANPAVNMFVTASQNEARLCESLLSTACYGLMAIPTVGRYNM